MSTLLPADWKPIVSTTSGPAVAYTIASFSGVPAQTVTLRFTPNIDRLVDAFTQLANAALDLERELEAVR